VREHGGGLGRRHVSRHGPPPDDRDLDRLRERRSGRGVRARPKQGMKKKYSWLIALVVVMLLMVACGPQMATPTSGAVTGDKEPTPVATEIAATVPAAETEEVQPPDYGQLPVDADDWRALGSPDAPITIVEYSDFQ